MRSFVFATGLCAALLVTSGVEAGTTLRGIPINLGDKVFTEISPAGDTDRIVFDAHEGSKVTLELSAQKQSEVLAIFQLLAPSGKEVGADEIQQKKKKLVLKNFVLPETGKPFNLPG